jgi:small subunit ribosomal protein S7
LLNKGIVGKKLVEGKVVGVARERGDMVKAMLLNKGIVGKKLVEGKVVGVARERGDMVKAMLLNKGIVGKKLVGEKVVRVARERGDIEKKMLSNKGIAGKKLVEGKVVGVARERGDPRRSGNKKPMWLTKSNIFAGGKVVGVTRKMGNPRRLARTKARLLNKGRASNKSEAVQLARATRERLNIVKCLKRLGLTKATLVSMLEVGKKHVEGKFVGTASVGARLVKRLIRLGVTKAMWLKILKVGNKLVGRARRASAKMQWRKPKLYKGEIHDRSRSPIEILGNMIMRQGKSRKTEVIINRILQGVRKGIGLDEAMDKVPATANRNVSVKVGLFKRRISGILRSIPVPLPEYKIKREAWKRIVTNARARSERTIEAKMIGELLDAWRNEGRSVKARNERYKEIKRSKIWLKHIRYQVNSL